MKDQISTTKPQETCSIIKELWMESRTICVLSIFWVVLVLFRAVIIFTDQISPADISPDILFSKDINLFDVFIATVTIVIIIRNVAYIVAKRANTQSQKLWISDKFVTELFILLTLLIFLGFVIFLEWVLLADIIPGVWLSKNVDIFSALTAIGATAGGIVLTINAVYIGKRADAQDKTAEAQIITAKAQVSANEQDLFNYAIKHLGSEDEIVRLGGIHTLYKLAADESNLTKNEPIPRKYLTSVSDILCAYVRSKTNEYKYKEMHKKEPSAEIQRILDLLTKGDGVEVFKGQAFDFSRAQLQGAEFSGANLQHANFSKAQLQRAAFYSARLQHTIFWGTCLQAANFGYANLQGAVLYEAQLQFALFLHTKLQASNLLESHIQGATFEHAQLQAANLYGAQLQATDFSHAQLQGVRNDLDILPVTIEKIIRKGVEQDADMAGAIVKRGLTKDDIEKMKKDFNLEAEYWNSVYRGELTYFFEKLEQDHIGEPPVKGTNNDELSKLPNYKGANLGEYNNKEAEKMIEEYKKDISDEPED